MKNSIFKHLIFALFPIIVFSQTSQDSIETKPTTFNKVTNNLSGSFESNSQWYLHDKKNREI